MNYIEEENLKGLTINRLFCLQRIQLDTINHYLLNDNMYDKNDVFNILQEIIAINLVIKKKLKNEKR